MKNINNGDLVLALKESKWWILGVLLFVITSTLILTIVPSGSSDEETIGVVRGLNQNTLSRPIQKKFFDKKRNGAVYEGESIHSGTGKPIELELRGGAKILIQENTLIEVSLSQKKITLFLGKIKILKKSSQMSFYNADGEELKIQENELIVATKKPQKTMVQKKAALSFSEINKITALPLGQYDIIGLEDYEKYAEIIILNPSLDLMVKSESLFDDLRQKKRAIFRLKKENGLNHYSIHSKGEVIHTGEFLVNRSPKERLFPDVLYIEQGDEIKLPENVELTSNNKTITLKELKIKTSDEGFKATPLNIKRNDYNVNNVEKVSVVRKKDPIIVEEKYEIPYLPYTLKLQKNISNKIITTDQTIADTEKVLLLPVKQYGSLCINASVAGKVHSIYRKNIKKCTKISPLVIPEKVMQLINIDEDFRFLGLDLKNSFDCSEIFYGITENGILKTKQMQLLKNRKIKYRSGNIPRQILISCDGKYTHIKPQHPILPFAERVQ